MKKARSALKVARPSHVEGSTKPENDADRRPEHFAVAVRGEKQRAGELLAVVDKIMSGKAEDHLPAQTGQESGEILDLLFKLRRGCG